MTRNASRKPSRTVTPSPEPTPIVAVAEPITEPEAAPVAVSDDTEPSTEPEAAPVADAPVAVAEPVSPADTFTLAWRSAITDRDHDTGDIATGLVSGVTLACSAIRGTLARTASIAASQAVDMAEAMSAGPLAFSTEPWRAMLLSASNTLAEACRSVGSAPAVAVVSDNDKRNALAVALYSLGDTLGDMLGEHVAGLALSDDTLSTLTLDDIRAAVLGSAPAPLAGEPVLSDDGSAVLGDNGEPVLGEPVIVSESPVIVRARAAVLASGGRRSTRSAASAARGSAPRRSGGSRGSAIADHVAQAVADGPLSNGAIRKAITIAYPSDARPSLGAIGTMSDATVAAHGLARATVNGAHGYTLA